MRTALIIGSKIGTGKRMLITKTRTLAMLLVVWLASLLLASPAQAANCYVATGQGTTGPSNWQSYCWIDFTTYNDTAARSASGQSYSLTLQDGTILSFVMKVSGAAINAAAAPSWGGASVGNTSFTGIGGRPVVYQTAAGTTTVTFSGITLTPPSGASTVTAYMFVAADAESSNEGESLSFQTNGTGWTLLDQAGPISGATYPTYSGIGTGTFTETGVPGTVGAYIVGSSTPTTLTTTMVGGGLQGSMFAVRFSSIRLTTQISGARANAADQFAFSISAAANGTVLASGTSTGTGLGPFQAASLSTTSAISLKLDQTMAAGSINSLTHYLSSLSCTNGNAGSSTVLPTGTATTSYTLGSMQFGDQIACTFTETPYPHLTLRKTLAGSGRQFTADQFIMNIDQGTTTVATTTTGGTGATVTNGATPQVQGTAGLAYKFSELGSGATSLSQYTATMTCANANTSSTTVLPTTPGGTVTVANGDVITCTIRNTKKATNAFLTVLKDATLVSDPVNGTTNPKYIPGAIVRYSFTVANTGASSVDNNTVWLVDSLPAQLSVDTVTAPVFVQGSPTSGLTFTAANDLRYSNAATAPTSFAACTYTPVAAYDPAVKFICLNPKGIMAGSSGTPPSFTLSVRAQVK